jgi:hypothetical protein
LTISLQVTVAQASGKRGIEAACSVISRAATLGAGSSYVVVTRNVARLLRRGFSLEEIRFEP